MSSTRTSNPRFRGRSGRGRLARPRGRSRGVSDVIATIILLALTVVLFAGIFAFVTSFPSPPAQTANQFQATLLYHGGLISGVNITHLAGPQVPSNAQIYVKSAHEPGACFSGVPVMVSAGISTPVWTLGQTWYGDFHHAWSGCGSNPTTDPFAADNLTVYIISNGNLLFSAILPGQPFITPPTFIAMWTTPSPVIASSSFKVYTTLSGNLASHRAYVNLGGIVGYSGATSPVPMWFNSSQSAWQYNVTGSNISGVSAGTYYGVVNVTGQTGLTSSAVVPITIAPSFSASVTPSPGTFKKSTATAVTFITTLTNFGSLAGSTVNISLFVNGSSGTWTSADPPFPNAHSGWWITPSTAPTIGAYSTLSWAPVLTSPSEASVITYTVTISVTLTNAAFGTSHLYTFTTTASISGG